MKTISAILVALCVSTHWTRAQTASSLPLPVSDTTGQTAPSDTPYAVAERGANHRVWQRTTYETTPDGKTIPHLHQYTELASGLHYQKDGQWVESKETIEILPDGTAAAVQGQHQAYFPGNIYEGVVEWVAPDGKHLKSRPLGLSYDDGTKTVLIAELKDSIGQLVGNNQVIYPDAFTDFKADLRYTYTKAGFEQDIILREQLLTPESYGLIPATARLQILTEFFDPPRPAVTRMNLPDQAGVALTDEGLDFGAAKMMSGRAFLLGSDAHAGGALVGKSWVTLEGRQFLVEEVPVEALVDELVALPVPQAASIRSRVSSKQQLASHKLQLPAQRPAEAGPSGRIAQVAQATTPSRGLVLDYQTVSGLLTNFTCQGDLTYYISGGLNLCGTNTFEGNAVIKYTNGASITFVSASSPKVVFRSSPYRPVVFTARDDNTIGEPINGSSGYPSYNANPALNFPEMGALSLSDFRISYAKTAISISGTPPTIYNAQLVNCGVGISWTTGTAQLRNALFANVNTNFLFMGGEATGNVQNVTFSGSAVLLSPTNYFPDAFITLTNCILVNVTNVDGPIYAGSNGFYKTLMVGSGAVTNSFYPFQQVGAANYYLTNGCAFTNAGTTNIDANLLVLVKTKTTCPPVVYANTIISTATNLDPRALRDTDTPDLGYHYDPFDYVFSGVEAKSNLTFTAGTAVGWYDNQSGAGYGIEVDKGATVTFNGTATAPCWLARYDTVQEGGNGNWKTTGWLAGITSNSGDNGYSTNASQVVARFTKFSSRNYNDSAFRDNNGFFVIRANHCEFWAAACGGYDVSLNGTNCLFFRIPPWISGWRTNMSFTLRNCTIVGGNFNPLYIYRENNSTNWPVLITDCAFDGTTINMNDYSGGNTNITYRDYNAFLTNANRSVIGGSHDVTNLVSFNWQSNWLGSYYLSTNSPLVNTGSVPANVRGLYHFTTQTNQVKETNSVVDIGYHYVAVDTNGIPLDSNGDGIPDYIEDANGNGLVDAGETNWGLAILVQPASQTVIQGTNVTFTVTAAGVQPLNYRWYFNGTNLLPGAANASLILTNVQTTNAGNYRVVVTNGTGSMTSSVAVLTVDVLSTNTLPYGASGYRYLVVTDTNLFTTFYTANFNDTNFSDGQAAFGTTNSSATNCPLYASYKTFWITNTDLLLRRHFYVPSGTTNLTLGLAMDDDAQIYLNGILITNAASVLTNGFLTTNAFTTNGWFMHEECATDDELVLWGISSSVWHAGDNLLAVHGHDNMFLTYADVQISCWPPPTGTNPQPPSVQIVSPVNQTLLARSNVIISATATNTALGVNISWVEFFANATSLGFSSVPTNGLYQFNWIPPLSGTNILTAMVMDSQTNNTWSAPVTNYVRNLPVVTFVFPTNGQIFPASPTNTTIQVTAVADRAVVANVVFYQGTNIVGATNAGPPYTVSWNNVTNGTYTLHVQAIDSTGISGVSSNISVIVEPTNRPPSVFVGPDRTNYLSTNAVLLTGWVSDDGLPVGSTLTIAWTNLSGGTNVTFVNSNLPVTDAYFGAAGVYVLQLSASDSQYTTRSNFTVTVLPANQPPYVNAGTNQTLILPALPNTIPLPSIQLNPITNIDGMVGLDYFPASNSLVASVSMDWGGSPATFLLLSSNGLSQQFTLISNVDYEVNIATVRNTRGGFKVGEMLCGNFNPGEIMRIEPDGTAVGTNMWVDMLGNTNYNAWLVLSNMETGSGYIAGIYVDRTGVWGGDLIAATSSGDIWRINSTGQATLVARLPSDGDNHEGLLTVPDDTQKYGPWAGHILSGGGQGLGHLYAIDTNGVVVNYNFPFTAEDILIIPENENFFGVDSGSDGSSGQILGASASQFQGMAGDILFAEERPFSAGGLLYRVHWNGNNFDFYPLTHDGNRWEQITFAPAGLYDLPSANGVQLQGVVTNDGELFHPTSNHWSVVSGPGPVTFGDPAQTNTTVEFTTNGDFILQLSAYDGQYTSSSNVTIHVIRNQAPWVSAGADQVIATNTTTLAGSVTDDGLPFGITNVAWSVVSPPNNSGLVNIYSPTNLNSRVDFQNPGTYVLRLTADDGQASSSADVVISVEAPSLTLTPSYGIATRTNVSYTVTAKVTYTNNVPIHNATVKFHVDGYGGGTIISDTNVLTDIDGLASITYFSTAPNLKACHRDTITATASVNPYPTVTTSVFKDWGQNLDCGDVKLNQNLGAGGCESREWSADWVGMKVDFCVFSGSAGDIVNFATVQYTVPLMMILRGPSDQLIAFNFPAYFRNVNGLSAELPATGDYVLEVASIYSNVGGPYDLYYGCANTPPPAAPEMHVLYNGTNVPNGGTVVFPPTSQGMATNISLVVTNAGGSPFEIVGMGTNGDFTFSNYIWGSPIQGGTSTNLGIIFNANTNGLNFGAVALATNGLGSNYIVYFMANTFPTGAVPTIQLTSPTNESIFFYTDNAFDDAIPFAATVAPGSVPIKNASVRFFELTTNGISGSYYQLDLDPENLIYTNIFSASQFHDGDHTFTVLVEDQNNQSTMSVPVLVHILSYTPPPTELPGIELLYQGTNVPNGGTIVFPLTTAGVPTNISLIITNNGAYPLGIKDIELDGYFTLTNETLNSFVPIGGSIPLGIIFNAPSNVVNIGQLLIDNNASCGGAYVVTLVGNAYPPGYTPPSGTNLPPVAVNDQFTVQACSEGNTLYPLVNDYDTNGDTMTIVDVTPSDGGTTAIINNGTAISYTPPYGFASYTINGVTYPADGFTYKISDSHGCTAWGVVSIILDATGIPQVNITDPPSYSFPYFTTNAGAVVPITVSVTPPDNIVKVDFYLGENKIGEVTNINNGVYTLNWTATFKDCDCDITASATDKFGQVGVAQQPIHINVLPPPGVHGPTASLVSFIGSDGTNTLLNSTDLNTIRDGLVRLYGLGYQDQGSNVVWQLEVYTPDGTLVRSLTNGTSAVATTNTPLATCDLTTLMNGVYDLRLTVISAYMETNADIPFRLESNLKIGQFSFSQQDLVIPVNGIPLTVTRTYNSINPSRGDFGYGWTYAINSMNVSLDESREDVADLDGNSFNERNGGSWDVTLTLPNGQTTTFYFYLDPMGNGVYEAKWKVAPGVVGVKSFVAQGDNRLETLIGGLNGNRDLFYWHAAGPGAPIDAFDFPGFVLTMQDDTRYTIDRDDLDEHFVLNSGGGYYVHSYGPTRLSKIGQRSGDTITINSDSVVYTASNNVQRKISIKRDPRTDLIVSISDPSSITSDGPPAVKYEYDASQNLIDVQKLVDRDAGTYVTNSFAYTNANFPHYITGIINADGTQVAKNFYDNSGKLIAVQDANGNLTQFIHNTTNNLEMVIDRRGCTNTYVYDLRGNVIAQTNALGQVTTMAYDVNNNKTNEITFLNDQPYATNSYIYNTNFNVIVASTDPLGHTNGFVYDQTYGQLLASADAKGNVTTNTYDSSGNLISTTDALGHGTTNFYNYGLLTSSVDVIGTITTNYYNEVNTLVASATLDASGNILSSNSFAYDANVNRTNSTVWRQVGGIWTPAITTYIYDAMNRVVQTINPDGGTNAVFYNATGKQQATIDPLGHMTSYEYDNQGRLWRTTFPDLTTESSTYDANGNRATSTDRAGKVTSYFYDALNRLTNTVYADNTANTTVYDGVGRVVQSIDAGGTITGFNYDATGRRIAVTNAFGTTVAMTNYYSYDANGNQITFTDGLGHTTTNVFDVFNRQVQVKYSDGTKTGTAYDAAGRRIAETNQDNIVTRFDYDGVGRLTCVTNALNQVTRYQYDEAGNEIAQVDALDRTNVFAYDGMGRRIAYTRPDGQKESFAYDAAGNLTCYTNFNSNYKIVFNQYDALNRLTNRFSEGYSYNISDRYTYTTTGQRESMTDGSGTTTYYYDSRGRLTRKIVTWGYGLTTSLNYRYDANGYLTNLWSGMANGVNLAYGYDPLNRLTNVLSHGQLAASYGYDLAGNLYGIRYGNGVTNLYQYDSLNRLTNLVWKTNGNIIASFAYTLGASGYRKALSETVSAATRSYTWQYDQLYRLTNEVASGTAPTGNLGYQYDVVGNRTNRNGSLGTLGSQTLIYNPNDWLTNTDSYDSNGNTTGSGTSVYDYDAQNRLINVNSQVYFTYDADGNRVSKKAGSITTYYLVDDRNPSGYPQVMEEHLSSNSQPPALNRVYAYGLALISQQQIDTNTLLPSAISYYGYDGHGSVRFLTDTNGAITDTCMYDAYGMLIASTGTTPNNYLYTGQQWDFDLALYYNRARYLNPYTGRFLTADADAGNQSDPLSLHKYLYAADNPVDNDDPSGNDFELGGMLAAIDTSVILGTIHISWDQAFYPWWMSHGDTGFAYDMFARDPKVYRKHIEKGKTIVENASGVAQFKADISDIRQLGYNIQVVSFYGHGDGAGRLGTVSKAEIDFGSPLHSKYSNELCGPDLVDLFRGVINPKARVELEFCSSLDDVSTINTIKGIAPQADIWGAHGIHSGVGDYGAFWHLDHYEK